MEAPQQPPPAMEKAPNVEVPIPEPASQISNGSSIATPAVSRENTAAPEPALAAAAPAAAPAPAPPAKPAGPPPKPGDPLPSPSVRHIMTRSLRGEPAVLADGAVEVAQVCASEFLSLVVSEARVRVAREGRASVTDADILGALGALGFKGFVEPLRAFVQTHYAPRGGGGGPMSGAKRALEQAQAVQRPVKPKQEKLVVCPFPGCGKSFVESTGMRRHYTKAHPSAPPLPALPAPPKPLPAPRPAADAAMAAARYQAAKSQAKGQAQAASLAAAAAGRLRHRLDCPKCKKKLEVHLLPAPQRTIVKCDACGQMMEAVAPALPPAAPTAPPKPPAPGPPPANPQAAADAALAALAARGVGAAGAAERAAAAATAAAAARAAANAVAAAAANAAPPAVPPPQPPPQPPQPPTPA